MYLVFPGEGKLLLDHRLASILHPNSLQLTETLNNWVNVTVSEFISFFFVLKYYFSNRRAIVISPRIFRISKIESPDEGEFEIIETMLDKVLELGLDFLEEFFVINKIDTGLVQEVNHKIVCEFLLLFVRKIHGSLVPAIFDSFLHDNCSETLCEITELSAKYKLDEIAFPYLVNSMAEGDRIMFSRYLPAKHPVNIENAFKATHLPGFLSYKAVVLSRNQMLIGYITEHCELGSLSSFIKNNAPLIRSSIPYLIQQLKQLAISIESLHLKRKFYKKLEIRNILVTYKNLEAKETLDLAENYVFKLKNLQNCYSIDRYLAEEHYDTGLERLTKIHYQINWKQFGDILKKVCFLLWDGEEEDELMILLGPMIEILWRTSTRDLEIDHQEFVFKYFKMLISPKGELIRDEYCIALLVKNEVKGHEKPLSFIHGLSDKNLNFHFRNFEVCILPCEIGEGIYRVSSSLSGTYFSKCTIEMIKLPLILIFQDTWEETYKGSFNFYNPRTFASGDWTMIDQNMKHTLCFCQWKTCKQENEFCSDSISASDIADIILTKSVKEKKKITLLND